MPTGPIHRKPSRVESGGRDVAEAIPPFFVFTDIARRTPHRAKPRGGCGRNPSSHLIRSFGEIV